MLAVVFVVGGFGIKILEFYNSEVNVGGSKVSFAFRLAASSVFSLDSKFFLYGTLSVIAVVALYILLGIIFCGITKCVSATCKFCLCTIISPFSSTRDVADEDEEKDVDWEEKPLKAPGNKTWVKGKGDAAGSSKLKKKKKKKRNGSDGDSDSNSDIEISENWGDRYA